MTKQKTSLKSLRMTDHDWRCFEKVRDLVQKETGWSFKQVHQWFHSRDRNLEAKPLSMVAIGQGEELKQWAENFVMEGGKFDYYDPRAIGQGSSGD